MEVIYSHALQMKHKEMEYSLATVSEALQLLTGRSQQDDALSVISKLASDDKLFLFKFNSQLMVPTFQFNQEQGIYASIPTLVKCFRPVSDKATYNWFMTYNEDLEEAPADCLAKTEKLDKLVDLAGLFVNLTTYRSVNN